MAPDNRPGSRKKNIVEGEASIKRRGSGLDSKPIQSTGHSSGSRPGGGVRAGGGIGIGTIIMVLVIIFFVMKFGSSDEYDGYPENAGQNTNTGSTESFGGGDAAGGLADVFGSLIGGYSTTESDYSSYETTQESSPAQLDMNVDPSARQKYTSIIGQGADVVTIMVYLCGTDLESRSGMGTADLQEMAAANLSDNVNLIVYTGGCKKWKNNIVSSNVNQILQIKQGGVKMLEDNMGKASMSDPSTLTSFIKYCSSNFPANRNELILWDHGSGSLSGYAYDEKYPQTGSM
ncbi:MAG: peptidase C11, partial [Lachnospiraceae bacterium]|nr:peptidase C11 [Lachnospiraceae bacterium]